MSSEKHATGEPCADIWAFGCVVEPSQTCPRSVGGHWQRPSQTLWDALGHFEGCLEPAGGCSETFLETSGTLWDASECFQSIPGRLGTISSRQQSCQNPPRGIGSTKLVFFCDLRASRKRLEDIPEGFQDAPGHSWRHPVRSWTLWDASGSLQDTLGGLKHYACSVFCGLRMPPGRPRTLKHYACSVFCGLGRTMTVSRAGRDRLAGPHQDLFFSFFSLSNEFSF